MFAAPLETNKNNKRRKYIIFLLWAHKIYCFGICVVHWSGKASSTLPINLYFFYHSCLVSSINMSIIFFFFFAFFSGRKNNEQAKLSIITNKYHFIYHNINYLNQPYQFIKQFEFIFGTTILLRAYEIHIAMSEQYCRANVPKIIDNFKARSIFKASKNIFLYLMFYKLLHINITHHVHIRGVKSFQINCKNKIHRTTIVNNRTVWKLIANPILLLFYWLLFFTIKF